MAGCATVDSVSSSLLPSHLHRTLKAGPKTGLIFDQTPSADHHRPARSPMLGKHTIFGRVHDGMDIVKRMSMVPTTDDDRPKEVVKILKASHESSDVVDRRT